MTYVPYYNLTLVTKLLLLIVRNDIVLIAYLYIMNYSGKIRDQIIE